MSIKLSEVKQYTVSPIEIDFNGNKILVNKYISEATKMFIAKSIKDLCFQESILNSEEGSDLSASDLSNKNLKHTFTVYYILKFYTDIEIDSENYFEICDNAIQSGLFDIVLSNIAMSERKTLNDIIEDMINEKYRELALENTVEMQLKRFLEMAIEKIPDEKKIQALMKSVSKQIKNFDPSKLSFLNDTIKEYGGKEIPDPSKVVDIADKILKDMKVKPN